MIVFVTSKGFDILHFHLKCIIIAQNLDMFQTMEDMCHCHSCVLQYRIYVRQLRRSHDFHWNMFHHRVIKLYEFIKRNNENELCQKKMKKNLCVCTFITPIFIPINLFQHGFIVRSRFTNPAIGKKKKTTVEIKKQTNENRKQIINVRNVIRTVQFDSNQIYLNVITIWALLWLLHPQQI